MKQIIQSATEVDAWIQNPQPAIFKGQDLRTKSTSIAALPLTDCVFLGCDLAAVLVHAAADAGCLVVPARSDLPFKPFSPGLYTPAELYDRFDPNSPDPTATYHLCLD